MASESDSIDQAIGNLHLRRNFQLRGRSVALACLIREPDWRPLKAHWWRKKEASLIGVDLDGNFLLRHCDGTVRYWDHKTQADEVVAPSVRAFIDSLV